MLVHTPSAIIDERYLFNAGACWCIVEDMEFGVWFASPARHEVIWLNDLQNPRAGWSRCFQTKKTVQHPRR